jgi:hypothetical protein
MKILDRELRQYWPNHHRTQLDLLEGIGCVTIGDVLNHRVTEAQMLRIPRVGSGTLRVIRHTVLKAMVDYLVF